MMAGARDPPTAGQGGGAWTTTASSSARQGTPTATAPSAHSASSQQQPPQRAAAVATPPPGLLLIDMPHLREALARYFPQLVAGSTGAGVGGGSGALPLEPDAEAQLDILLPSIVSCLEAAYGTHFTKRVLHDSSPTGKASLLAEQLAAQAGRFKVRAHQQKATEAVVVDPDTLEPSHGGSSADGMGGGAGGRRMGAKETSWTLHDSSATVAMTLDVIKYASRASVVVVVSARAELAETLQHLVEGGGEEEDAQEGGGPTVSTTGGSSIGSTSPPPAVYVCALGREVAGTALERWLLKPSAQQQRQQSQSAPRPVTLERVLASAAEALWTRGRQNRRTAGLCPKGTACSHLRGTSGEAGGSSCCGVGGQGVGGNSSPRPFTAHKITHLCQYLHPCGQGQACAAVGPLHRLAFIHGGVGGGAGSSSTNASSSRSTLPLLAPTGSTGNRAQQLATSATLHNRLPLSLHHHAAAPNVPSRLAAPAPSRPAAATVVSRSPPLDVPAPRPTKPTGSGSLLAELALEGGETGAGPEAKAGFCMSPLSKAARQASLWWYEAHRAQQRAGAGAGAGGEYEEGDGHQQEWGDEDALGREHGAIFAMSL